METRELEVIGKDKYRYFVYYEELISNIFYMLNCAGIEAYDIKMDLFEIYRQYTKKVFNENNIRIASFVSCADYNSISEHGYFVFYKDDSKSKYISGVKLIKPFSKEEFENKFQPHPEICLNLFINNDISEILVEKYKHMNWYKFRNK